jgi:hypothetical protein
MPVWITPTLASRRCAGQPKKMTSCSTQAVACSTDTCAAARRDPGRERLDTRGRVVARSRAPGGVLRPPPTDWLRCHALSALRWSAITQTCAIRCPRCASLPAKPSSSRRPTGAARRGGGARCALVLGRARRDCWTAGCQALIECQVRVERMPASTAWSVSTVG